MLKMTPQNTMESSMNHYAEKFEEILEEKTEKINKREETEEPKIKVEEFNWGDISITTMF